MSTGGLLLTGLTVGDRTGQAVQVVGGRIAWLGSVSDAPVAARVIAGEGALLTPAFVDAHVHATATGLSLTAHQRRQAQRATLDAATALGIGSVHEMAGPEVSSVEDLTDLLALAGPAPGPRVVGYWGELAARGALDVVGALGLAGAGGDLFCDGAFGSHTAALSRPYTDRTDTGGALRFGTAELVAHVRGCTAAGVQAGFHCIGSAAADQVLAAVDAVAEELGRDAVRACRHRLEHVEMVDDAAITRLAEWGMVASVQPAFDAAWGGADGMYAARLGAERAAGCNPLADLADGGVTLALGSDAPVTPLDPWGGVHAAVDHRTPGSGLRPFDAFDAATHGGWYAARTEHPDGPLAVGAPADLALWSTEKTLTAVLTGRARAACRLLLVAGEPC